MDLPKTYVHEPGEDTTYELWESSGFFSPDAVKKAKKSFSIAMPPPNATGTLHTGHAMMLVYQDLMVRYHRMKGEKTLWVPGTDHASIATQNKVEKLLAKEGLTRQELGREEFLARVNEYVESSRTTIRNQIRKMGSSCDWSRERYTLDEGLSEAVNEMFVRMYRDGLVHRDYRMVNWCPRCTSTLADDEVKHVEEQTSLSYIKYLFKDGSGSVVVATTRPETLFGDVAVAVHPTDARYKEHVGKALILPLVKREIPLIAESTVDPSFGTGALKITPAHAPADLIIGKKFKLSAPVILSQDGRINLSSLVRDHVDVSHLAHYEGMDRFAAREQTLKELTDQGLIEKTESYTHTVGTCYRCESVIEPYISLQWFVAVDKKIEKRKASLKELMLDAVRSHKVTIIPEHFEKTYFQWIENLHDWCISRQIWFGHRLPVYYCSCGETIVAIKPPARCPSCKGEAITQDEDTLDTWFSSGLWTFSTLGWPKNNSDLKTFHPTSVMETGYDILFFWVARMILMSCYALGEVPFHTVYLHGMVLDMNKKKMSKSKEETLIDPLDVIPKYGTDALRLSMVIGVTPGNNLLLNEEKIASYRNFVNKLWNIGRFILSFSQVQNDTKKTVKPTLADEWIASRLAHTIQKVSADLEAFQFSRAAEELRLFTWDDLADWYLEISKVEQGKHARLLSLFEMLLALWHPFMPFVTETLYGYLPSKDSSKLKEQPLLMMHPWPNANSRDIHKEKEEDFELLRGIIISIRNARAENGIPPSQKIQAFLFSPSHARMLEENKHILAFLARLDFVTIHEKGDKPTNALFLKNKDVEIYLPLGMMNKEEEYRRLTKEIERVQLLLTGTQHRMADTEFVSRAPKHIVEKEREKAAHTEAALNKLKEQLNKLS